MEKIAFTYFAKNSARSILCLSLYGIQALSGLDFLHIPLRTVKLI